jgi:hypothetical protein
MMQTLFSTVPTSSISVPRLRSVAMPAAPSMSANRRVRGTAILVTLRARAATKHAEREG